MKTDDTKHPDALLRLPEVAAILGVSETTIWRWRAAGIFPPPIQLGPRLLGYTREQLDDWLESRRGRPVRRAKRSQPA